MCLSSDKRSESAPPPEKKQKTGTNEYKEILLRKYARDGKTHRTAEYGMIALHPIFRYPGVSQDRLALFPKPLDDGNYRCPFCPPKLKGLSGVSGVNLNKEGLYCSVDALDMHVSVYHYPWLQYVKCRVCTGKKPFFLFADELQYHYSVAHPSLTHEVEGDRVKAACRTAEPSINISLYTSVDTLDGGHWNCYLESFGPISFGSRDNRPLANGREALCGYQIQRCCTVRSKLP